MEDAKCLLRVIAHRQSSFDLPPKPLYCVLGERTTYQADNYAKILLQPPLVNFSNLYRNFSYYVHARRQGGLISLFSVIHPNRSWLLHENPPLISPTFITPNGILNKALEFSYKTAGAAYYCRLS